MTYTYHYHQPDDYHFSLDSIYFTEFVADQLKAQQNLAAMHVLDLCAGCGVIGLQLAWYLRALRKIDFVEVQTIYTSYFHENVRTVQRPELELCWHALNYDLLQRNEWENKYDLIISNPPYFQAKHGMLSPSDFKNRCRFFIDSSFENFIHAIVNTLAYGGKAYFLLRPLHQHGIDVFANAQRLLGRTPCSIEKIAKLRGIDIVCITK